eukprot:11173801-Lingulodinium_polyedra.AAC.1
MDHGARPTPATRPILGPQRKVALPPDFHEICQHISQNTVVTIPKKYRARYLRAWVGTLEGMVFGGPARPSSVAAGRSSSLA